MKTLSKLRALAASLGLLIAPVWLPAEEAPAIPAPPTAPAKPAEPDTATDVDKAVAEKAIQALDKVNVKLDDGGHTVKIDIHQDQRDGAADENLRDVKSVGQDVVIAKGERVRSLTVTQGSATVDGEVMQDAVVVNGKLRINGKVHGDAVNVGRGLMLGTGAWVKGDAVGVLGGVFVGTNSFVGGDAVGILGGVRKEPGAEVKGNIVPISIGGFSQFLDKDGFEMPQWINHAFRQLVLKARPLAFSVGWTWVFAGLFVLGYAALLALFPRAVAVTAQQLEERTVTSFFMGLLSLPLLFFVSLILSWTIVIPFFLFAAFLLTVLFGKVGVLRHLGGSLLGRFGRERLAFAGFLTGVVLVSLIYVIPFVGLLAWVVLTMWGTGAALLALFASFRKERTAMPAAVSPAFSPTVAAAPTPVAMPIPTPTTAGVAGVAGVAAEAFAPSVPPIAAAPIATTTLPGGVPEAISLPRAGFGRRFASALLDWIALAFVIHGLLDFLPERLQQLLLLAYFVGFYAWKGTTLGGIVLGLKVVRLDGRKMDFACALVRTLGAMFSVPTLGISWFWCAWDKDQQSWHDKLAGTVVVRVEKLQPLV